MRNKYFSKHLWKLVKKIRKYFVCIVVLHKKITLPMDKNCGNEIKISLMSKTPLFYAPISTPYSFDQTTREFKQLLGHPSKFFLLRRIQLATHE